MARPKKVHPTPYLPKNGFIGVTPVDNATVSEGVEALCTDLIRRARAGELVALVFDARDCNNNRIVGGVGKKHPSAPVRPRRAIKPAGRSQLKSTSACVRTFVR